jgi:hypothetical protein
MTATATKHVLSTEPRRCRHMCPGGAQCGCDADVRHTLHICPNGKCICHEQDRYELGLTAVSLGLAVTKKRPNSPAQPQNESRTA